jgi:hypothetical protein
MSSMGCPKTLHLTNFYHTASGGIGAFYRALFQYANEYGREIRLVAPGAQNDCERIGEHSMIYYVKAPRSPISDRRYLLFSHSALAYERSSASY